MDYNIGDKVIITDKCIENISNSKNAFSIENFPNSTYIKEASSCKGIIGNVFHTDSSMQELIVEFNYKMFYMKNNWVEKA